MWRCFLHNTSIWNCAILCNYYNLVCRVLRSQHKIFHVWGPKINNIVYVFAVLIANNAGPDWTRTYLQYYNYICLDTWESTSCGQERLEFYLEWDTKSKKTVRTENMGGNYHRRNRPQVTIRIMWQTSQKHYTSIQPNGSQSAVQSQQKAKTQWKKAWFTCVYHYFWNWFCLRCGTAVTYVPIWAAIQYHRWHG